MSNEESYYLVENLRRFLNEQDTAAAMAQMAAGEAAQAQQAAQMQAQQAEQEMMALRQGVGGAIGEILSMIFQMSQKGADGVRQAKAAVSGKGAVLHDVAEGQVDSGTAATKMNGILTKAGRDLQRLGG